eukprot:CAMPEP_0119316728 /NCGR_PEP_ID=MMETSP1333-20130426/40634_1 /TAXON_ID=418940 /ORGANISM="Scyphosphaera apsteinii, Strain RCC1455" /LENGTH=64 /DNA_ID=CAMNT_0007322451 /DNA_START=12 /DNA_END=202 /DNA_ORIENTATION=+
MPLGAFADATIASQEMVHVRQKAIQELKEEARRARASRRHAARNYELVSEHLAPEEDRRRPRPT